MLVFGRSPRSKILLAEKLSKAIALAIVSEITAPGVRLNKSEDLNILDRIWVAVTLNDFMAGLDTGTPHLEDVREDVSPVIQAEPMQGEPTRVPSVGA